MPFTVPPYVQYTGPLFPLRNLMKNAPPEGDRFLTAEIDWGTVLAANCTAMQFQLQNSPVPFSQIVALSVDNTRNGSDVTFQFPDSGSTLVVPAYAQGTFPVFTNALTFYVIAPAAIATDVTVVTVLNSMPPPVALQSSQEANATSSAGINLANGTTALLSNTVSGVLENLNITVAAVQGAVAGAISLTLTDGTGATLWNGSINLPANGVFNGPLIDQSNMAIRFKQGLSLLVSVSAAVGGTVQTFIAFRTL